MGFTVETTRFGTIEVPEDRIITFPHGLIGFPDVRSFVRLPNPSGGPFEWLQAVDAPAPAFVITDPRLFLPDYTVAVRAEDLRPIGIESMEDGTVVVILVVPRDPRRIT